MLIQAQLLSCRVGGGVRVHCLFGKKEGGDCKRGQQHQGFPIILGLSVMKYERPLGTDGPRLDHAWPAATACGNFAAPRWPI